MCRYIDVSVEHSKNKEGKIVPSLTVRKLIESDLETSNEHKILDNFITRDLLQSKKSLQRVIEHANTVDSLEAIKAIWIKPELANYIIFVKKEVEMKRFLPRLILFVAVVLLSSGKAYEGFSCKCKCHDGVEECQAYCWRCAHKHHEDCECKCHDDWERYEDDKNTSCRRHFCDDCESFHWGREKSSDYGMKKGWLPKKRPYLHPIRHFPSLLYAFDDGYCE